MQYRFSTIMGIIIDQFVFSNMGRFQPLFIYFVLFTLQYKLNKAKRRYCAWALNPGPQDGGCRWIH